MIFKQHFVDLILSGKKTQTRRLNRGYYKVGHSYAIQPCRICKGILGYRIEIDHIWRENCSGCFLGIGISVEDAWAEGEFHPLVFEESFREIYPKWDRKERWGFRFNLVEVTHENEQ